VNPFESYGIWNVFTCDDKEKTGHKRLAFVSTDNQQSLTGEAHFRQQLNCNYITCYTYRVFRSTRKIVDRNSSLKHSKIHNGNETDIEFLREKYIVGN